jgi:integrase
MATIRRRNKKYQVQIRKNSHDSISKTFVDLKSAKIWANHIENKMALGDIFVETDKKITLRDVVERYLKEITPLKKGRDSEKRRINHLLKEPLCNQTICSLETKHFIAFRNNRIKDGNKTCHYDLVLLSHMYNVAINQWNLFKLDNPLLNVPKPKLNLPRERRLTEYEYNFLVKGNYPQQTLRHIIEFAIETGMRRGEILNIKQEHIKGQTLLIPQTKNGYPRTIPLTKRALYILDNTQTPFPYTPNALRLAWDRLRIKGNIEDLHFHDLRHEAISRFFEKGLSIPEVALISGHKDVRMLFRYTHLKAEDILKRL